MAIPALPRLSLGCSLAMAWERLSVWDCVESAEMILGVPWLSGVDASSMAQQSGLGYLGWFINMSPELLN